MDPIAAGLNLQTAVVNLITALLNKASTPAIDSLIIAHEARLNRIAKFNEFLATKLFGFHPEDTTGAQPK